MMKSIDINVINTITGIIHDGITRKARSVMSGLRMSFQPAKPALPIMFLYEELPNVNVFSAHKMLTTFCAPFPNTISHFKILAMP